MLVQKWTGVSLGQSVVSKVGKSFKLILVDLFDYTVVHWCQDRLFAREILVKVIHIPFGFLEMTTKCENVSFLVLRTWQQLKHVQHNLVTRR